MTILLQIKPKNKKQTFSHFKDTWNMLVSVKMVEANSVYTCLSYIIPNMHIFLKVILEGYLHRSFMSISLRTSLEQIKKVTSVSSEAQVKIFLVS